MTNRTIKSNGVTFVDMSDKRKLEVHISSNLPTIQIYDNNTNNYTPDWSKTNLTLEVRVYLDANDITDKITTFTWSGVGGISSGTKYTIKSNVLSPITSIQTYSCEVVYDGLSARSQMDFTRVENGSNGTVGAILGSYNTLAELKATHPTGEKGDTYLVQGELYVWCLDNNDWQNVGNIQGPAGYTPIKGIDYFDGVDGQNGKDGVSIAWQGDLPAPPSSPKLNWVYRNTTDHTVQIYNGTNWELMVLDGSDGSDGTPGSNGLSVFITYNDSATTPSTPTGNGTTNGWHTNATTSAIWMSQKVAENATSGTWGTPIKIKGENGTTYYTWIKYADTPTSGMSDSPDGKTYMGIAYNKTTVTESTNYSDYNWSLIKGTNGVDGINGRTYYTWVKYADDVNGTNMSDNPDGKYYIGLAYNKSTATESNTASDYQWSLFRGSDGIDGKNGTPASVVHITPSALYFKSTNGQNGTFTPQYIYLYPQFQTVTYSNWQYSTDGGITWKSVSGINGLSVATYNSVANSLRIERSLSLYTNSVTSISFRCNSNNSAIYDIVSIAKIYDIVDLQVGGTNLIPHSKMDKIPTSWAGGNGFAMVTEDGYQCARLDGVIGASIAPNVNITDKMSLMDTNQEYTVSAWVKVVNYVAGTTNPFFALYFSGYKASDNTWLGATNIKESGDLGRFNNAGWKKITWTLKFDSPMSRMLFYVYVRDMTGTLFIRDIKVEKGNTATDWSPAPEDIIAASSNTSVMLSNETHLFIANPDGTPIDDTVTLDVVGYQGATQKPTTIGTITGTVTGLTATISNNNTTNTKIAVTVAATLVQDKGILTIPVTVEGRTINKMFSWAKTKNGADGKPGDDAVTFKVFSENGYILSKDTQRITLQTFAYAGSIKITADATYQWYTVSNGVDTIITGATGPFYDVVHSDITFRNVYKCIMTFDGIEYADSVTIEDKNDLVTTFTTKPTSYSAGDIWVIGTDISASDMPVGVTYGEILKAEHANTTYSKEDWIPATRYDQILKELKDDVSKYDQFFSFDSSTGLNIKAVDANGNASQFSTTLSSDSLSFNQNNEAIASISGSKMHIKEVEIISPLTVTGKYSSNTMLQAPTINLGGFSLIIESNGSLSIISNN